MTFVLLIILTIILTAFPGLELKTSHSYNIVVCLATGEYRKRLAR